MEIVMKIKDRFCFEDFELSEAAIDTIATMIGTTITDIVAEENRNIPDKQKIKLLRESLFAMSNEQQEIYKGNNEMKHSVIERYSTVIQKRFTDVEQPV
jgi:hypothetical protein